MKRRREPDINVKRRKRAQRRRCRRHSRKIRLPTLEHPDSDDSRGEKNAGDDKVGRDRSTGIRIRAVAVPTQQLEMAVQVVGECSVRDISRSVIRQKRVQAE
jgi:hypothetical protein